MYKLFGFKIIFVLIYNSNIECGQNITQAQSGVLTSPKWPQKYDGPSKGEGSATCNWYLSVRPGSRVMLHFQNFAIEGEPNGKYSRRLHSFIAKIFKTYFSSELIILSNRSGLSSSSS